MKNFVKLFRIIALSAVIIFGFTACDDGNDNGDPFAKNKTPTADDFIVSGLGPFAYDNTQKAVTIKSKEGKTNGSIYNIRYNETLTAPRSVGTYTITFDVGFDIGGGWNNADDLVAGPLIINPTNSVAIRSEAKLITVSDEDVYVFGSYNNKPCYWKNGDKIDMPDDCNVAFSLSGRSYYNNFTVSGTDVFVAGASDTSNTACYWKNGEKIELPVPDNAASYLAYAITIVGTDVFVAGVYSIPSAVNSWNISIPCYWKNGERTDLTVPNNTFRAGVSTITVVGSDVYVAGDYEFANGSGSSCYWKNGTRTDIGVSLAFTVSGSDWYSLGVNNDNACYLKNGTVTRLSTNVSQPTALAISESDLYVLGYDSGVGCYWKNGVKINGVGGNDITVVGSDVYIADSYFNGLVFIACYWKNGVKTDLVTE